MATTKLQFDIDINAPKEKVWSALWNDATYREWTNAFSEGSYAQSDWKEGSKILFLGANGDGMYSTIQKLIPNEQMTFKHLGVLEKGVEQKTSAQTKEWEGALEEYFLTESNGKTHLKVTLNSTTQFEQYFRDTFPKAIQKVKEISER